MALQFSTTLRNDWLDRVETVIGASAILTLRTGGPPANCGAANTGTVLATINLPVDWMSNASSGSKSLLGTWQDASADASGTAGHFRIHDSGGTTCHMQGTVTITGGGGDLTLDNPVITVTQTITIVSFTLTAPGA